MQNKSSFEKIIVFYLFLFSILKRSDSKKFRCDYTYCPEFKGYLKYHEIPAIYPDARLRCQMEGALIASPLDDTMNNVIRSVIDSHNPARGLMMGINAMVSKGDFASAEGIPLANLPHKWAAGEPDNKLNSEQCLVMDSRGEMSDESCYDPRPYICYKKSSTLVMNECGTTDPEYKLDSRTGSCYKFNRVPRSYSRSYMNCMAEGGYLAIINSLEESQVIRDIFAKNPVHTMIGHFWKDVAFIGFHDYDEHGEWITIQGQTLKDAGFDNFSPGEPNNSTTGEYCGAVYRNGLLDDLWCDTYAYICEKDPDSLVCEDNS